MNLDWHDRRTQLGIGLIALGILALLGQWGIFAGLSRLVGLILFTALGLAVLSAYRNDPTRIWPLPVGFGLIGLGISSLDVAWTEGAFLLSLGLGFLAVWMADAKRERWWAIIPGGVLLTLGLTASYEATLDFGEAFEGTLFFLGLAATFAALYVLPSVRQRWAIWPAAGLALVALITLGSTGSWIVPLALILVGAVLFFRPSRR